MRFLRSAGSAARSKALQASVAKSQISLCEPSTIIFWRSISAKTGPCAASGAGLGKSHGPRSRPRILADGTMPMSDKIVGATSTSPTGAAT